MAAIQPMSWRSVENRAAFSTGRTFPPFVDKAAPLSTLRPQPPPLPPGEGWGEG